MHTIQYLRVIVTEKCNLRCFYCHKEGNAAGETRPDLTPAQLQTYLGILYGCGIRKIKFMGGEPTLYPALPEVIGWLREKDAQLDISMVTNGVAAPALLDRFIRSGLNRVNISLHGLDEQVFRDVTKGHPRQLQQCMGSIGRLKAAGMLGKINYVLLRGVNEAEFYSVLDFAHRNDLVLDVLNYLSDSEEDNARFVYSFGEIRQMIGERYEIVQEIDHENAYSINSQRLHLKDGGVINLKVNQLNQISFLKACQTCPKIRYCREGISAIRLTNYGTIKPCLFRDDLCFDLAGYAEAHSYEETAEAVAQYLDAL